MSLLELDEALQPESVRKRGISRLYGGPTVSEISERYDDEGSTGYLVRYDDESEGVVSYNNYMLPSKYLGLTPYLFVKLPFS